MQTKSKMATKLLKAALFAQVGAACNCFGNGACTNNECQCDAGWKGPDCATLDVLPAAAASPGFASRPTWGAAQLQEAHAKKSEALQRMPFMCESVSRRR